VLDALLRRVRREKLDPESAYAGSGAGNAVRVARGRVEGGPQRAVAAFVEAGVEEEGDPVATFPENKIFRS
jgi:hypothetical protein